MGDPEGDAIIYVPSNTGEGRATRMRRAEYDEEVEKHFRSLEEVITLFNAYITTLEGLKVGKNDAVLAQLQESLQEVNQCITLQLIRKTRFAHPPPTWELRVPGNLMTGRRPFLLVAYPNKAKISKTKQNPAKQSKTKQETAKRDQTSIPAKIPPA